MIVDHGGVTFLQMSRYFGLKLVKYKDKLDFGITDYGRGEERREWGRRREEGHGE